MSLQLVQSGNPAVTYQVATSLPSFVYNAHLVTSPRIYKEEIASIEGFYYDIARDKYVLVALMDQIFYPSWKYTRFDFSPETGLQVSREDFEGGAIGFAWTTGYENGDWKKVYAHRIFSPNNAIVEVRNTIPEPTSFQLNNPIVQDSDVGGLAMNTFVLSRENNIIAFSDGNGHFVYRFNYNTGSQLTSIRIPEQGMRDMAYENNELAWGLMNDNGSSGGFAVAKFNFISPKFQMYSRVPPSASGTDQDASIAFDSVRKSLAVFRKRAADSTGAAQHIIDIYKPIEVPTDITDPVPVTHIKANSRGTLVAHVIGEKGTGGGNRAVKVTNTNASATLKHPTTVSQLNGSVVIPYDAPDGNSTDTITLSVTV